MGIDETFQLSECEGRIESQNILTLPGQDVFQYKHYGKHPAAGLHVTIKGKRLSGYHGIIRDSADAEGTEFLVEVNSQARLQRIPKARLALRQ
jgi:transcription elongation factor